MKVKMCGLYRPEDIAYANEVQPDYVGFVFYEKSHRAVTKEQAAEYRKKLLPGIRTVGVFVNEDPKNIIELLEEGILDVAQLHGDETEEDIQYLQAVCHKPVIKAVKVRDRYDVEAWLDSSADCYSTTEWERVRLLIGVSLAGSTGNFSWQEDCRRRISPKPWKR